VNGESHYQGIDDPKKTVVFVGRLLRVHRWETTKRKTSKSCRLGKQYRQKQQNQKSQKQVVGMTEDSSHGVLHKSL
jgi:hypothetical protein